MQPEIDKILSAPSQRFFRTSDKSLMTYLNILFYELRDKSKEADEAGNHNEAMWYADASALVLEITLRYSSVRPSSID